MPRGPGPIAACPRGTAAGEAAGASATAAGASNARPRRRRRGRVGDGAAPNALVERRRAVRLGAFLNPSLVAMRSRRYAFLGVGSAGAAPNALSIGTRLGRRRRPKASARSPKAFGDGAGSADAFGEGAAPKAALRGSPRTPRRPRRRPGVIQRARALTVPVPPPPTSARHQWRKQARPAPHRAWRRTKSPRRPASAGPPRAPTACARRRVVRRRRAVHVVRGLGRPAAARSTPWATARHSPAGSGQVRRPALIRRRQFRRRRRRRGLIFDRLGR